MLAQPQHIPNKLLFIMPRRSSDFMEVGAYTSINCREAKY
jgi:hypothetical protein